MGGVRLSDAAHSVFLLCEEDPLVMGELCRVHMRLRADLFSAAMPLLMGSWDNGSIEVVQMIIPILRHPKSLDGIWTGGGAAVVHSVYHGTVNLQWKEGIAALQPREVPGSPVSLTLKLDARRFGTLRLQAGMEARFAPEGLYLQEYLFSCSCSTVWDPALRPWISLPGLDSLRAEVEAAIIDRRACGGLADVALGRIDGRWKELAASRAAAERLAAAWRCRTEGDCAAVGRALAGLIGLGEGLTPSGDDFCAGVLAALRIRVEPEAQILRLYLEREIRLRLNGTNDVSAQFLRCAALGQFSEPVLALLGRPLGARERRAAAAVLGAVGHSSGVDTLNGIYLGLSL